MTRQYKNPFEDPDAEFYGKKVKDYKFSERKETSLEEGVARIPDYIYVPKIKLYVAKEKSLHNLSWEDTHKELHKKGWQMLTIRQFIDFIVYLKQNKSKIPDVEKILDEILTQRKPFRAEWLDAKFSEETRLRAHKAWWATPIFIKDAVDYLDIDSHGIPGIWPNAKPGGMLSAGPGKKAEELYISYNHKTENGELVAKNKEPLEKCLMENCDIDTKSFNRQGLPTKKGKDIGYGRPMEGRVAAFGANEIWVDLRCCWIADSAEPYLGVRAALKVENKTIGGEII